VAPATAPRRRPSAELAHRSFATTLKLNDYSQSIAFIGGSSHITAT
jgi:hypothetical protein